MMAKTNDPKLAPWIETINELANTKKELAATQERLDLYRMIWEKTMDENDQLRAELERTKQELREEMYAGVEARRANRYMQARLLRFRAF